MTNSYVNMSQHDMRYQSQSALGIYPNSSLIDYNLHNNPNAGSMGSIGSHNSSKQQKGKKKSRYHW